MGGVECGGDVEVGVTKGEDCCVCCVCRGFLGSATLGSLSFCDEGGDRSDMVTASELSVHV